MSVFAGIKLPKLVYETQSDYNGVIQVYQTGEKYRISVGGFTQSVCLNSSSAKTRVWGKIVDVLEEEEPSLASVMVLGLGGGTTQHLISHRFPEALITSLEIDPKMVEVAKQFFGVGDIPNHTIIVDDACRVIVDPDKFDINKGSFDAIVVDIFNGMTFPALGNSGNFVGNLKKIVKQGGLIIFNRIYLEDHQDDVNAFMELVEGFLADTKFLIVAGYTNSDNILIYGRS